MEAGGVVNYYKPKHFDIRELVSPLVWKERGEMALQLLDPNLLRVIDRLQEKFGTMIINNWQWGGNRDLCGFRGHSDIPKLKQEGIYLKNDQHQLGNAIDAVFKNTTAEIVRQYIIAHPDEYPEITGIEKNVSWLHIDTRNWYKLVLF